MFAQAMKDAAEALKDAETEAFLSPGPIFVTAERSSLRTLALRQICKEGLPAKETGNQVALVS